MLTKDISSDNDIWNKSYMNCGNEMKTKKWSSQWAQFMQLHKLLYYDGIVDGKRYKTKARYNKTPKEEAMSKLTKKQQQLIDELTSTNNRLDKISLSCFENGNI